MVDHSVFPARLGDNRPAAVGETFSIEHSLGSPFFYTVLLTMVHHFIFGSLRGHRLFLLFW